MYLVWKYGIIGFEEKCWCVLEYGFIISNVCNIFYEVDKFDELMLKNKCMEYIWY